MAKEKQRQKQRQSIQVLRFFGVEAFSLDEEGGRRIGLAWDVMGVLHGASPQAVGRIPGRLLVTTLGLGSGSETNGLR